MAELLIRTVDKVNPDPYLDVQCTKRGDVIVICEDGHPWSKAETTSPYWTIVKVPGVPVEKLTAYLVPEPGDPVQDLMLQRRAFKFDLGTYDGKTLDEKAALDLKTATAKRADPNVLADDDVEAIK